LVQNLAITSNMYHYILPLSYFPKFYPELMDLDRLNSEPELI